jgi:hypothetical protein
MSVLNLGVQGLDLGRWVRLIHRRDFDLQARGWIRSVAGLQSLVSVALLALAVISYLGHPIEQRLGAIEAPRWLVLCLDGWQG